MSSLIKKLWRDRFGTGTVYEAASASPADNTPTDAAGLRDLENRVATAIDTDLAAHISDTTAIHGIANTATLIDDAALAATIAAESNARLLGNRLRDYAQWTNGEAILADTPIIHDSALFKRIDNGIITGTWNPANYTQIMAGSVTAGQGIPGTMAPGTLYFQQDAQLNVVGIWLGTSSTPIKVLDTTSPILYGLLANRPAAATLVDGTVYFNTDAGGGASQVRTVASVASWATLLVSGSAAGPTIDNHGNMGAAYTLPLVTGGEVWSMLTLNAAGAGPGGAAVLTFSNIAAGERFRLILTQGGTARKFSVTDGVATPVDVPISQTPNAVIELTGRFLTSTLMIIDSGEDPFLASFFTAKGQILSASANGVPALVPAPTTNDHVLTVDLTTATGWKAAALPISGGLTSDKFGDGSDGACNFTGSATVAGFVPSGNVYTLTRDIMATSITLAAAATIRLNGYRLFCQGAFTWDGTLQYDGPAGLANGTAPVNANGVITQTIGALGNVGAGSTPSAGNQAVIGGASGAGGTGNAGANAGGSGVSTLQNASAVQISTMFKLPQYALVGFVVVLGTSANLKGGSAGAGGGGDGTVKGGSGGCGGGLICLFVGGQITQSGTGVAQARGGAGGTPASGNAGGGGGGGGGGLLIYSKLAPVMNGTTTLTGGAAGGHTGTGTDGAAGSAGVALTTVLT